jgi:hypothetical protein
VKGEKHMNELLIELTKGISAFGDHVNRYAKLYFISLWLVVTIPAFFTLNIIAGLAYLLILVWSLPE